MTLSTQLLPQFYQSAALVAAAAGVQFVLSRSLRGRASEEARRILVPVRNSITAAVLIGLGLIWAQEMHAVLLSVVAVLAAIILVSRDLLVSLMAALASTAASKIEMGSLVRIKGHRGIVVDRGALFLSLAEVQAEGAPQYTGRLVSIPNSWLMTDSLTVEDYTGRYVAHTVSIMVRPADATRTADRLAELAWREFKAYGEVARAELARFERKTMLDAPSGEPRVTLVPLKPDEVMVSLRMAMPKPDKFEIEQRLLRAVLGDMSTDVDGGQGTAVVGGRRPSKPALFLPGGYA